MIRGYDGERTTARRRAQEIVYSALAVALAHVNYLHDEPGVTAKEREEISRFVQQEADRLARAMGYTGCPQE